MHHNAGGFNKNNEILVLMKGIKIDRLSNQLGRSPRRDYERDVVPGLKKILGLQGDPVHQDHSSPDKLLNPRTRQPFGFELARQIEIKALPPLFNDKKVILTHRLMGRKKMPVLPKIAQA